ncbi:WD40-repeat-containing domain protein [Mycena pura]|uniref:WD40-repeat-containing domain protein n=1 Tax=Mycena pura TaxID=153505 RepID=A0AAD6UZK8_9AGAR|nr:WD40-repeat-containing domain protein [Mycena pura]
MSSPAVDYVQLATMGGHVGAILSIAVRDDGEFLASGGSDGTRIFHIISRRQVQSPAFSVIRGPTTVITWIKREDDVGEALFYGTQAGYLVCWRKDDLVLFFKLLLPQHHTNINGKKAGKVIAHFQERWDRQLPQPAEITGIAFDASTNRLAVCHRGGVVQMFSVDAAMTVTPMYQHTIANCVPRAVVFGPMHGNERELLVFSIYCGLVYILRGGNAPTVANAWNIGARIGDVAVDEARGLVCLDDPSMGVNVYRLGDHTLIKSFPVPVRTLTRIRQVRFLNTCTSIVSGSDHGVVYIFDRRTGALVSELRVHPDEWVQTIATATIKGIPTIFAAKSRDVAGVNEIFIYQQKARQQRQIGARVCAALGQILRIAIIVAAVCFVFENVFARVFTVFPVTSRRRM